MISGQKNFRCSVFQQVAASVVVECTKSPFSSVTPPHVWSAPQSESAPHGICDCEHFPQVRNVFTGSSGWVPPSAVESSPAHEGHFELVKPCRNVPAVSFGYEPDVERAASIALDMAAKSATRTVSRASLSLKLPQCEFSSSFTQSASAEHAMGLVDPSGG